MDESFDIVQLPKHLRQEDLPDSMEVDKPFEVNGVKYVMCREDRSDLRVCREIDSQNTTAPQPSGSYYTVKRV